VRKNAIICLQGYWHGLRVQGQCPDRTGIDEEDAEHAKSAHKMDTIPPDVMAKVKKAIPK